LYHGVQATGRLELIRVAGIAKAAGFEKVTFVYKKSGESQNEHSRIPRTSIAPFSFDVIVFKGMSH
jgi:hypothetical protein